MTAGSGEALRQQLCEAAQKAVIAWEADAWGPDSSPTDAEDACNAAIVAVAVEAVVPVVEVALAAARVATATEIAEAIEARITSYTAGIADSYYQRAFTECADVARRLAAGGSVPAPKGDQ